MPENMNICRFLPKKPLPIGLTEFSAVRAYTPCTCLQLMWVLSHVCRLFANNVGSFSFNSGRRGRIFANNSGRKNGCLQVLRFMFAGRYTYPALGVPPQLKLIERLCCPRLAMSSVGSIKVYLKTSIL
jgi:hypothetical protein